MSRGLLIAEYYINIKIKQPKKKSDQKKQEGLYEEEEEQPEVIEKMFPLYIATSHFESLDNPGFIKNRFTQMHDTFGVILKNEPNCVVLGDFNFDNKEEYESNVEAHSFEDVIETQFTKNEQVHPVENFSFSMPQTHRFGKWRPDKICMPTLTDEQKSQFEYYFKAQDAQKIGAFSLAPYENDEMHEVAKDGIVRTPSDHMGLIVDIALKKNFW